MEHRNSTTASQLIIEWHRERGAASGPLDTPALAASGGWTGN